MINKYSLGAAIFLILMTALVGVSRAISWLTQSSTRNEQRIAVVEGDRTRKTGKSTPVLPDTATRPVGTELGTETSFSLAPLEEAGTYIQRQKRVARDPEVVGTKVEISSNAAFNPIEPVPTQPTTRVPQQPDPAPVAAPANPQPSQPATPAPAAAPAVPALW